jgi:hypothetical protein
MAPSADATAIRAASRGGTAFALVGHMLDDGLRCARVIFRSGLLLLAIGWGAFSTFSMAQLGLENLGKTFFGCRRPVVHINHLRLLAAAQASTQFMIEEPRFPAGIDELVTRRFIDARGATDTWGTPIRLICGADFADANCSARSAGPDREWGTEDDLSSDNARPQY